MTWHACSRTKGAARSPALPAPTDGANASAAQSLVRQPSGNEPGSGAGCRGGGKRQPRTGPALPRAMPVGEAGTDSPFPPRGMEGERKMFQAQAQERTQPWQAMPPPQCSACCLVQLALSAQWKWLPARGSLCGVPWQGAK